MQKPSRKVHIFIDPIELSIVVPLIDTLFSIIILGKRGLVVIMHILIVFLL